MKFIDTDSVHSALAHMWCDDAMSARIEAAKKAGAAEYAMYNEMNERWLQWKSYLLNCELTGAPWACEALASSR